MAITDKDVEKLKGTFVTKDDLRQELSGFATKEDIFGIKEELKKYATKDDLKDFKNEVLTGQDKIIGELEKAREDRTLALGKDREQDQRIVSLEGKVQKIEDKVMA